MNTVEGALVLSALTLTAGVLTGGIITLAQHAGATSLARDAARAEALGEDGRAVVASRDGDAQVSIASQPLGGMDGVRVSVTKSAALFDVTASAVTVVEPDQ